MKGTPAAFGRLTLRRLASILVVIVAMLAWSVGGFASTASRIASNPADGPSAFATDANGPPEIAQSLNNTIIGATSNYTEFSPGAGDTLVIFVAIHGFNTVDSITDSLGDLFTQEFSASQVTHGGDANNGLAIWLSSNVTGGDTNITITMHTKGSTPESNAIEIMDVAGVTESGGTLTPLLGEMGTGSNSTYLTGRDGVKGDFQYTNSYVPANSSDLVLTAIASRDDVQWTPNGTATEIDEISTNSSVSGTNMTLMAMSNTTSSTGTVYDNATIYDNSTGSAAVPWISESMTLYTPPDASTTITFTESGLPTGTPWTVWLGLTPKVITGTSFAFSNEPENSPINFNVSTTRAYIVTTTSSAVSGSAANGVVEVSTATTIHLTFTSTSANPIQHVVIIMLENENVKDVTDFGPYENYLAHSYASAPDFHAACHDSQPNYQAIISAESNSCSSTASDEYPSEAGSLYHNDPSSLGDHGSYKNMTLADSLMNSTNWKSTGFTWAQYAEDLPNSICSTPYQNSSIFVERHAPFLAQTDLFGYGDCAQHVFGLENGTTSFNSTLSNGELLNFSMIAPNLCDNGHDDCNGSIWQLAHPVKKPPKNLPSSITVGEQADVWLKQFLTPILNYSTDAASPYHNNAVADADIQHTVFFVLYDEAGGSVTVSTNRHGYAIQSLTSGNNPQATSVGCHPKSNPICGGPVYFAAIVPSAYLTKAGVTFAVDDSDYGLTATIEWLFGLPHFSLTTSGGFHNPGHFDNIPISSTDMNGFPIMQGLFDLSSNGY
jgi:hypothetical protein